MGFGSKLFAFSQGHGVSVHSPDTLTYFRPGNDPDILGIALPKDITCVLTVESVANLSSDHILIQIVVGGDFLFKTLIQAIHKSSDSKDRKSAAQLPSNLRQLFETAERPIIEHKQLCARTTFFGQTSSLDKFATSS